MSKLTKALTAAAGNAGESLYVEDVFSTYLYTGNGTARDIENGIDLDGEGGLVWTKSRDSGGNYFTDTERGAGRLIASNNTDAESYTADTQKTVTAFNENGYSLGTDTGNWGHNFSSQYDYASWAFRKAEKFFDVVTWTGDGTAGRQIAHNLGSAPAVIITKNTNASNRQWFTYHQSLGNTQAVMLDKTNAAFSYPAWNNTTPTDSVFFVNSSGLTNQSGKEYVAYLFASDAGGFGDDGSESIIKCGSFTTDATGAVSVDLGFEPQWILYKKSAEGGDWQLVDSMRGLNQSELVRLVPNTSGAETTYSDIRTLYPTATGFGIQTGLGANDDYIYIAIRRPMKTPESGTEVFGAIGGPQTNGFPTGVFSDASIVGARSGSDKYYGFSSRLTGTGYLNTTSTGAENSSSGFTWDRMTGFWEGSWPSDYFGWSFKRATGFMDVVAYSGTGSATTQAHNLGVTPELIFIKDRTASASWVAYSATTGPSICGFLNSTSDFFNVGTAYFNSTNPTSSVVTIGSNGTVNASGNNYIAYLFATLAGVSKVGSYTGTGNSLDIDCGFSNGARFVMIKRTDSSSDWWVWDTARGIVSGNDPTLRLNSTAAETTTADYIDPLSSGFTLTTAGNWLYGMNYPSGNYIFLAIA